MYIGHNADLCSLGICRYVVNQDSESTECLIREAHMGDVSFSFKFNKI